MKGQLVLLVFLPNWVGCRLPTWCARTSDTLLVCSCNKRNGSIFIKSKSCNDFLLVLFFLPLSLSLTVSLLFFFSLKGRVSRGKKREWTSYENRFRARAENWKAKKLVVKGVTRSDDDRLRRKNKLCSTVFFTNEKRREFLERGKTIPQLPVVLE